MPERTASDKAILDNENESVIEQTGTTVPRQPDPPSRYEQDTEAVEGEQVINPPPGSDLIQRGKVQG